jgi:hypothetical protein
LRIVAGWRDRAAEVKEPQKPVEALVLLQIQSGCMGCKGLRQQWVAGWNSLWR